jgi:hypothetical protein
MRKNSIEFISLAIFVGAVIFIAIGFFIGNQTIQSVLLNLGTEALGILITIAGIDKLEERRRIVENIEAMAWRYLNRIDIIVWIWQGGRKEFSMDELFSLLDATQDDDPIHPETMKLLCKLGDTANHKLKAHYHKTSIEASPRMKDAFKALYPLFAMQDSNALLPPKEIAKCLRSAIEGFRDCLPKDVDLDSDFPFVDPSKRENSLTAQSSRLFNGYQSSIPKFSPSSIPVGNPVRPGTVYSPLSTIPNNPDAADLQD